MGFGSPRLFPSSRRTLFAALVWLKPQTPPWSSTLASSDGGKMDSSEELAKTNLASSGAIALRAGPDPEDRRGAVLRNLSMSGN